MREAWPLVLLLVSVPLSGCVSDSGDTVEANSISDLEKENANLRERNNELIQENSQLKERLSSLSVTLSVKNGTIETLETQKENLRQEVESREAEIATLEREIEQQNRTIDQLKERIRELENETEEERSSTEDPDSSSSDTSCEHEGQPERVEYLKTETETGNFDADAADEKRFWTYGQAGDDHQVEFAADVEATLERDEGGWGDEDWRIVDNWSFHVCPGDFEDYAWDHGFYTIIDDGKLEDGQSYRMTVTVEMDATGQQFSDSNEFGHYEG